jgi:hypothetical protein
MHRPDRHCLAQLHEVHQQLPSLFYRGALNEADASGVAILGETHEKSMCSHRGSAADRQDGGLRATDTCEEVGVGG